MTQAVDSSPDARWKARFHAARMSLPEWAVLRPDHCVFVSNASGTFEIYSWDRSTGATEQVTARANGTTVAAIDPPGEWIWWFDDHDGDEFGVWRKIPFDSTLRTSGSHATPDAVPGLPPSYPSGLCLGPDGLAIIGRSTDDGATIYAATPDQDARLLYSHTQHANVSALSRDGTLFAIEHSEHGDTRHPALRVLRVADGAAVADLFDGPGRGLEAVAFAPVAGDSRIICRHERLGRWMPFIWDVVAGAEQPLALDLPGDVSAHWFPDASALLVLHEYEARSSLYRYDLATGSLHPIEIPAGTVAGATARPDGVVEFMWSSGAEPPAVRDSQGRVVIRAPGPVAPESVPVSDAWVDGPGGRIHALVSKPPDMSAGGDAPVTALPTVFLVHGGPTSHDTDAFFPGVAAWVRFGLRRHPRELSRLDRLRLSLARRDRTPSRTHRTRGPDCRAGLGCAIWSDGRVAHRARRRIMGRLPHAARPRTHPRRMVGRRRRSAGGRLRRCVRGRDGGPAGIRPRAVRRHARRSARSLSPIVTDHVRRRRQSACFHLCRRKRSAVSHPPDRQLRGAATPTRSRLLALPISTPVTAR